MIVEASILDSKEGYNDRAGVIIYTIKDNQMYFLLGIDRKTRELTDFGGGCKNKQGENLIDSAWREFTEESCGIFEDVLNINDIRNSIAVTNNNNNTAIFFVKVGSEWLDTAESTFKHAQRIFKSLEANTESEEENIGVKWVKEEHFKEIAFNRRNQCMWSRIQHFLIKNCNYLDLYHQLMGIIFEEEIEKNIYQLIDVYC